MSLALCPSSFQPGVVSAPSHLKIHPCASGTEERQTKCSATFYGINVWTSQCVARVRSPLPRRQLPLAGDATSVGVTATDRCKNAN